MTGVVAETIRAIRNPDMVQKPIAAAHPSIRLTAMQNAKDHDHHTANAATTDDALALPLEEGVTAHHNVKNETTNELRLPATLATARPQKHRNPVDSEAAAHLRMVLAQIVLRHSRKSLPTPNPKQSPAKYKWRMKTPRLRWRE
jgi:hypothetical protein